MRYVVYMNQLEVKASIGIYDWEKKCLQKLVLDLQLAYKNTFTETDLCLSNYLDYTKIYNSVSRVINSRHFLLIEDVSRTLVKILMDEFCIVSWIKIKVNKPNAIGGVYNAGVFMSVSRRDDLKLQRIYTGWK